jgi:hypothetical protein
MELSQTTLLFSALRLAHGDTTHVKHVVQERDAGVGVTQASAVQVDADRH